MSPRNRRTASLFFLAVIAMTLRPESTPAQTYAVPWEAVADAVVARMDLQPGETVLLVAQVGDFEALVPLLRARVSAAGAVDLGAVEIGGNPIPGSPTTDFVSGLTGLEGPDLVAALDAVDLGVMLPGATPADAVYGALQERLWQDQGRTIHFHWAGAYGLDGVLLPLSDDINRRYVDVILETDYAALSTSQEAFESAAREAPVRVTTPLGTDITFRIGDRPVTRQDGDASRARTATARNLIDREVELPAGAIRVAPLENTVDGTIAFPPTVWGGVRVEGLVLTIEGGRVVDVAADTGVAAVRAELDAAGDAGYAFREFAMGLNPLLAIPDTEPRWIPYYGYGGGVVRLSLGDNTELGGAVGGGYVRWNFFTDATVSIGNETWVEGGRLVR
jgi:hypothetical protein